MGIRALRGLHTQPLGGGEEEQGQSFSNHAAEDVETVISPAVLGEGPPEVNHKGCC